MKSGNEKALAGALSLTMSLVTSSNCMYRGGDAGQSSHSQLHDEDESLVQSGSTGIEQRNLRDLHTSRISGLINTVYLWNLVTPVISYANITLLFAASMTVCAQVLITWLPVFIGRATKELTGGSTGQYADLHALSTQLGLAFLCIFLYVSLRGGTQVRTQQPRPWDQN